MTLQVGHFVGNDAGMVPLFSQVFGAYQLKKPHLTHDVNMADRLLVLEWIQSRST